MILSNQTSSTFILMKINNKKKAEIILNNDMNVIGISHVNNFIFCPNLNRFTCLEAKLNSAAVTHFYHIGLEIKDT